MTFNLKQNFSLVCIAGISILVASLAMFYRHVTVSTLIEQETNSNVAFATAFNNFLWPVFEEKVAASIDRVGNISIDQTIASELQNEISAHFRNSNVISVAIYHPEGSAVFSTNPPITGIDSSINPVLQVARNGNTINQHIFKENIYWQDRLYTDRYLINTYFPLNNTTTKNVDAVLELSTDISNSIEHIKSTQYFIIGALVVILSVLYFLLSFIFRRAQHAIKKHERLYAESKSKLQHQAYHDTLTGLPNKSFFIKQLQISLIKLNNTGRKLALLYIDLDRLKIINDSLGHDMGDHLINIASKRIESHLRNRDTFFRWGSDEFTIIIEDMDSVNDVTNIASRILDSMAQPIVLLNQELIVTTSIGIALFPDDCESGEQLIKNANAAVYFAKDAGRNRYVFYRPEMNNKAEEKLIIEAGLQKALQNNEFVLHYQPKVNIDSGTIVGLEALLRWQHPTLGLIQPDHFIPALEETGLINSVGEWVLHAACHQNKLWQTQGIPPIKVSVNISARQFRSSHLARIVEQALRTTGLAPQYLDLELTESMFISDAENAISTMKKLKKLGVSLSIDDFGSGYSSLSYLKRFPVDYLKIDRSFIQGILKNEKDAAITNAIAVLANSLEMTLVAEGVEDENQLEYLRSRGCRELQGFLFSKPLPSDEIVKVIDIRTDGNPTKQAIDQLFAYYKTQKSIVRQ